MRSTDLFPGGPTVSALCIGTSPLGGMPTTYGYDVSAERAREVLDRLLDSPISFVDTSNGYSGGESERRIGAALRAAGGMPAGLVIATKADPIRGATTFTRERVWESFRESCERLGVERFEIYHLHDPEKFSFEHITGPDGALAGMLELKEAGLVDRIGVAGGDLASMHRYVDTGVFDLVLNHNQYTLLDQSADALIEKTHRAGIPFLNAAPFASGILAKDPSLAPRYQYRAPEEIIVDRVARLREICTDHGVPLAAAALQFSTRDPRIASTVVGVTSAERLDALIEYEAMPLPEDLWQELSDV